MDDDVNKFFGYIYFLRKQLEDIDENNEEYENLKNELEYYENLASQIF